MNSLSKWELHRLKIYYSIFRIVAGDSRITFNNIASTMGYVGRGRNPTTILKHYENMLKKEVFREPKITLRAFKNAQSTGYFCRKIERKNFHATFLNLHEDARINYVIYLAGGSDFFITSREKDLDLLSYDLETTEVLKLYTPMYTIPKGWNTPMDRALRSLLECNYAEGYISREIRDCLAWSDIDWAIYNSMRENIRKAFSEVGREIGCYHKTVKSHFYEKVLPCCVVANYFFPKGYQYYRQAFLKIETKYEKDFVKALIRLPCTTYVLPIDTGLLVNVFHGNHNKFMSIVKKLEELGVIDSFFLHIPVSSAI